MVDQLDQEQIDALFKEIDPEGSQYEKQRGAGTYPLPTQVKVHRIPKKVVPRSYNPYHSPVVKAGSIVMNPEGEADAGPHCTVVRTLENYAQYRRSRLYAMLQEGRVRARKPPAIRILKENA